jgi:hypothetical protein
MNRYYHICRRGIGRPVELRTKDGRVQRGVITRVNKQMVYLRPFETKNYGGFGYGWGWGLGGFGIGFGLGAIAGLAFL